MQENVKTFQIGELSAVALRDGDMELPNDNKVFGVGRTPEEVAAVLGAAGQSTDKLALNIEPLLVKAKDRVLLFDTGAGGNFGAGAGKLQDSFSEAGIDPQSVTDIFLSHSHGDHVGGLVNAQGALIFPNATIHLTKAEWKDMSGNAQYASLNAAIKPKVAAFTPGAELVPGVVKAVEIKGHTPGHSGYMITSGQDSLLYVGDSMHHFVVSVQKPEWTISFDGDSAVASKSRADLIAASAANGQRIYAVHFPFPGIGKFEKQGDKIVWVGE
jgi:glyoxylase-like metal-dependent hydrolase (beta-lactamase superfamily II)